MISKRHLVAKCESRSKVAEQQQFSLRIGEETSPSKNHLCTVSGYLVFSQAGFIDHNLKVEKAYLVDLKPGDHYMSTIETMKIEFDGPKDPMNIYIKSPMGNSLGKISNKLMKFFSRETFWYMEAYPALVSKYPEIKNLSPKCFMAWSTYNQDFSQLLSWKHHKGIGKIL